VNVALKAWLQSFQYKRCKKKKLRASPFENKDHVDKRPNHNPDLDLLDKQKNFEKFDRQEHFYSQHASLL
jgi:hypothetical protein